MAEPIILDANITPLKKQIKDATQELQVARQRFGDLSTEAVEAAKKVAAIRDAIAAANEQAALFDPGKRFQALTTAASTAAGAVGAVQGAMGLFGAESEDVQKALLKVQSAMALSQGLSQLADLGKVTEELKASFKGFIGTTTQKTAATAADTAGVVANTTATKSQSLATMATSAATKAATISLKVMRGALISLGIPALVLGLVSLVQNFGAIKDAILNTLPGLKGFSDTVGNLVQQVTDFFGITSKANRELEALTKGTTSRNESIEQQIKLLSAQGGKEKEIFELRKKQTIQELTDLNASDRLEGKTSEERLKRRKELLNNLTIETATFNKRQADEERAAAEKRASEAKSAADKAKAEKERLAAEKKVADDKILADEKDAQEKKEAQDKEFQKRLNDVLLESRLAAIKDGNERAKAELVAQQEQELKDLAADTNLREEQKLALEKQLRIRNKEELDALEQSFKEQDAIRELEDLDKQMEADNLSLQMQRDLLDQKDALLANQLAKGLIQEEAYTAAMIENSKARTQIDKAEYDFKIARAQEASMVLGQLSALAGKRTAAGKALGIAEALINTSVGVTQALKQESVLPSPFDVVAKVANVATILASGLKAVKSITAVQVPGGGGGGAGGALPSISASAPSTSASAVPTLGTSPVTALGTVMANQPPIKAFVVESDVTSTQRRVADIERRAGF